MYSIYKIQLGKGISKINAYAFKDMRGLEAIDYNLGLIKQKGDQICNGCVNLKRIVLPRTTSLGQYDFHMCTFLEEIVIPDTITSINKYNFSSATYLRNVYFTSKTPPTLETNVFTNIFSGCIFHVPQGYLSTYTSAANYPSSSTYTYVDDLIPRN